MWIALCHFITCGDSCNHPTIKVQNYCVTTEVSLVLPLYNHTHTLSLTISNLCQLLISPSSDNFAISRTLCKWDHTVFNVLSLTSVQVIVYIDSLFPLLLHDILLWECVIICLAIHLLKDILVVSNFWLL